MENIEKNESLTNEEKQIVLEHVDYVITATSEEMESCEIEFPVNSMLNFLEDIKIKYSKTPKGYSSSVTVDGNEVARTKFTVPHYMIRPSIKMELELACYAYGYRPELVKYYLKSEEKESILDFFTKPDDERQADLEESQLVVMKHLSKYKFPFGMRMINRISNNNKKKRIVDPIFNSKKEPKDEK